MTSIVYSFPTGLVLPFAQEWGVSRIETEQLGACIDRWEKAVSARLFKASSGLGFDWVLAVPCEDSNQDASSDKQITNAPNYRGKFKILVKAFPSGKIYSMFSDPLSLEGEENNLVIQDWIAANLNNACNEWTGNVVNLLNDHTSVIQSFKRFIYKPFIHAQLVERLKLGRENLSFPVKAYISPFSYIPFPSAMPEGNQNQSDAFLYFTKNHRALRASLNVNPQFFTSNQMIIEKSTPLGPDIIGLNVEHLSDSISYYLVSEIFAARRNAVIQAFNDFKAKLNAELLKISHDACNKNSGRYYNWLQHNNSLTALYRKQALEAYPLLVGQTLKGMLVENNDQSDSSASLLASCVDNGNQVVELLGNLWGLPKLAVRSLQGITAEQLQSDTLVRVGFENLKDFKPYMRKNWWPDKSGNVDPAVQWYNFLSTLLEIKYWMDADWKNMGLTTDYASSLAFTQAFWKTYPTHFFPQIIQDMAEQFAQQMILPLIIEAYRQNNQEIPNWTNLVKSMGCSVDQGMSAIELALMQGKTYKGLNLISEIWYENYNRVQTEIVRATDHRCWPGLIDVRKVGELWAVPLCSAVKLAEESERMDHCVGTYVAKCLNERCHIISLRDEEGNSISTIEIMIFINNGSEPDLEIVQHKAAKNSAPSICAAACAEELLKQLKNPQSIDFKLIEHDFQQRISRMDNNEIDMNIGYPHGSAIARNAALKAWSFCLPRKYRGLTHAEWSKQIGLDVLVKKLLDCNPIHNNLGP